MLKWILILSLTVVGCGVLNEDESYTKPGPVTHEDTIAFVLSDGRDCNDEGFEDYRAQCNYIQIQLANCLGQCDDLGCFHIRKYDSIVQSRFQTVESTWYDDFPSTIGAKSIDDAFEMRCGERISQFSPRTDDEYSVLGGAD